MKKILFVGAEVMPYAATGGLGDVLGSLPSAIAKNDNTLDIRVIMPLYSAVSEYHRSKMNKEAEFSVRLAWREQYCALYSLYNDGVLYYFIDNEYYFKRQGLYGHFDDGERYAYFCMAVLECMKVLDFYPDILHAHDWHGALSIVYLNLKYRSQWEYSNIKTVFTIHNIEYQGKFKFNILCDIFDLPQSITPVLEYNGEINFMKAAIELASVVSTVSPRYADDILTEEYSHGLSHVLIENKHKLCGILNGIDYNYYNPEFDNAIWQNFSMQTFAQKSINKVKLQEHFGLLSDNRIPMISIISRLVYHKGVDLVKAVADRLLNENVQLVVLGTGEGQYESFFTDLQQRYPQKVRAVIGYDRDLSRRIYAASDIFLMPSASEPCGLSQMIASRYGAVPVVHEVGGLYDSIKGFWFNNGNIEGNGFSFFDFNADVFLDRIYAALGLYSDTDKWKKLCEKVMSVDFSWGQSAIKYIEIYNHI